MHKSIGDEPTPKRVLVCEDYENTRRILRLALRGKCEVDFATNVEEAREKADEHDLYLIDININGQMSGVTLMKDLKSQQEKADSRFIAFTAHDLPGQREAFLEAGFDGFLAKPFTLDELYAVLDA